MTKAEAIAAIEAMGGSNVRYVTQRFDYGERVGVAVEFEARGKHRRCAVRTGAKRNHTAARRRLVEWAAKYFTQN